MQLSFDPPFMPLQTAAIVAIACGVVFWLTVRAPGISGGPRKFVLIGLRGLVIAAMGFILLNPVVVVGKDLPKGKPPRCVRF